MVESKDPVLTSLKGALDIVNTSIIAYFLSASRADRLMVGYVNINRFLEKCAIFHRDFGFIFVAFEGTDCSMSL